MERPIPDQDVLVEDSDPSVVSASAVSYSPPTAWGSRGSGPGDYHGNDVHYTTTENASGTLRFSGSRVWYYSDINSEHGAYTISIDDSDPMILSSYDGANYLTQELLLATALDPGPHVLTLTNIDNAKFLAIDYFYFRPLTGDALTTGSTSAAASTPSAEPSPSVTLPLQTAAPSSQSAAPSPQNGNSRHLSDYAAMVLGYTTLSTSCVLLLVLCCIRRTRAADDRLHIQAHSPGIP